MYCEATENLQDVCYMKAERQPGDFVSMSMELHRVRLDMGEQHWSDRAKEIQGLARARRGATVLALACGHFREADSGTIDLKQDGLPVLAVDQDIDAIEIPAEQVATPRCFEDPLGCTGYFVVERAGGLTHGY